MHFALKLYNNLQQFFMCVHCTLTVQYKHRTRIQHFFVLFAHAFRESFTNIKLAADKVFAINYFTRRIMILKLKKRNFLITFDELREK